MRHLYVPLVFLSSLSSIGCGVGDAGDPVGATTAEIRPTNMTLYRVRTKSGRHVYTSSTAERQSILGDGGFDEGTLGTCYAAGTPSAHSCWSAGLSTYPNGPDGDVPFYRFRWYVDWNTPTDSRYYTTAYQDVQSDAAGGIFCCQRYGHGRTGCGGHWLEEPTPCNIFSSQVDGTHPIYQLMRADGTDHLYTTSLDEVSSAESSYGYRYERIVGYLPW
jgi:hypothetical protein